MSQKKYDQLIEVNTKNLRNKSIEEMIDFLSIVSETIGSWDTFIKSQKYLFQNENINEWNKIIEDNKKLRDKFKKEIIRRIKHHE